MNRTEVHPVEALLLVVWLALEAAVVLLTAAMALLLTVARWRPVATAPAAAPPQQHPITLLADALVATLEPLTVAQLRRLARAAGLPRSLTHTGRRDALLTALVGLEVAACS
jgi:L-aminopeptidase/D-esterase-like protein